MTPKQAVQRYADVLQNNTNSKYARSSRMTNSASR